ncbi:hypothetical protein Fmac_025352 [Flemingia macrophylla]|uniref:Aluminum-activated malate transporter n=1 Tax=Flemingia macrophylla TaxID=520843 RepID=A0ABD1LS07_9FABA
MHGSIFHKVVSTRLWNQCSRIWQDFRPARRDIPWGLTHIVNLLLRMFLRRIYKIISKSSRVMVNEVCAMLFAATIAASDGGVQIVVAIVAAGAAQIVVTINI